MNIGNASKLSKLSTKTIRYYEEIGLVQPSYRSDNGYRQYSEQDVNKLVFIQRARKTGFNIDECRQLLKLYENKSRHSKEVNQLVLEKAEFVKSQIKELQEMHHCLMELASSCQSNSQPECAILDKFSNNEAV